MLNNMLKNLGINGPSREEIKTAYKNQIAQQADTLEQQISKEQQPPPYPVEEFDVKVSMFVDKNGQVSCDLRWDINKADAYKSVAKLIYDLHEGHYTNHFFNMLKKVHQNPKYSGFVMKVIEEIERIKSEDVAVKPSQVFNFGHPVVTASSVADNSQIEEDE